MPQWHMLFHNRPKKYFAGFWYKCDFLNFGSLMSLMLARTGCNRLLGSASFLVEVEVTSSSELERVTGPRLVKGALRFFGVIDDGWVLEVDAFALVLVDGGLVVAVEVDGSLPLLILDFFDGEAVKLVDAEDVWSRLLLLLVLGALLAAAGSSCAVALCLLVLSRVSISVWARVDPHVWKGWCTELHFWHAWHRWKLFFCCPHWRHSSTCFSTGGWKGKGWLFSLVSL